MPAASNDVPALLILLLAACAAACGRGPQEAAPVVVSVRPAETAALGPAPAPRGASAPQPAPPRRDASASEEPLARARDGRDFVLHPRERDAVAEDVRVREGLLATAPAGATGLVQLRRNLADAYVELAIAAQAKSPAAAEAARAKAIAHYSTVLVLSVPAGAPLDDTRYFFALEQERAGRLADARSSYYELIKSSPQSRYAPLAYFAFGEMFLAEAQSDPSKLELAQQAYQEALKYPAPGNTAHGFALLRAAEVAERRGHAAKANALRARLAELPDSDPAKLVRRR